MSTNKKENIKNWASQKIVVLGMDEKTEKKFRERIVEKLVQPNSHKNTGDKNSV